MLDQISGETQVKRNLIINKKHGLYELPHKLQKDLRIRILQNKKKSANSPKLIELWPISQTSTQGKVFSILAKKLLRNYN